MSQLPNSDKFLAPPRHAFDLRFLKGVHRKVNALQNGKILDERGNVIGQVKYADGNVVYQFKSSGGGAVDFGNEWDPAKSYAAKVIVFFTPDGGSAGTYISLQAVTPGISPDTGAPNWVAFPNSPPGMWG